MGAILDRSVSFVFGVLVGLGIMAALGWFRFLGHIVAGFFAGLIAKGLVSGALAGFFSGMIGEEVAFILYAPVDEDVMPFVWHAGSVGIMVEVGLVFVVFGCLLLSRRWGDQRISKALLVGFILGALIFSYTRAPWFFANPGVVLLLPFWSVLALAPGIVGLAGGATGGLVNR